MLKRKPQQQRSKASSIAAPVGGWNSRDSLADMAIHDAVSMENWQPLTTTAVVRDGYSIYADGQPGVKVETLMAYNGGASEKFFSINQAGFLQDITIGGGNGNYLSLPASIDDASTPDSVAISITGDIDIRVRMSPPDWTPTSGSIYTKYDATGAQSSWGFYLLNTGLLRLTTTPNGTHGSRIDHLSTVQTGFIDNTVHWVRATLDVDDGLGNHVVTFYTSDDAVTWDQLGAVVTTAGTTSLFDGNVPLAIGANPTLGVLNNVFNAQLYNGINGTLVADFDAEDGAVGDTTVISSTTGETYTLNGTAEIVNDEELASLANGRFQHVNFTTSGGNYLVMCNGADDVYNYDGTTWTNPAITGVTSSTLNTVNIHKSRLWFTQTGTLKAWYLPTQSIAGAANALDLSAYAPHGGYLVAMGTWTMDAGYGVDDMAVFVTNQGDCLVYRGTDPSSATTWALVGAWWIGQPIGRRCFVKYKGDMLIICEDGLFSLANALQSSRVEPKLALTDKIQQTMQESVALYRNNFGWQVIPFDGKSMLIMNVPTQEGQYQEQYVMNTITGAWCKFTGWDANCWELFNDSIYFGGDGFVGRAFHTNSDNGAAIEATCQQAFNYFKTPGQSKRFAMMRPTLMTNGSPSIQGAINVDFDLSPPASNLSTLTITGATWDSALWDAGLWQNTLITSRNWQGATGIGYAGGVRLDSSTNGIQLQWVATDVVMEGGGII